MDKAIHSDFLIHWTGDDIENEALDEASKRQAYIQRLKTILKDGLWMQMPKKQSYVNIRDPRDFSDQKIAKPNIARTCFTELKLSETIDHAKKFGKLGIGVKRFFLFDRLGMPMIYIQRRRPNLFFSPYFSFPRGHDHLTSFFKNMDSDKIVKEKNGVNYDLFNESEWRIIYSEAIKSTLQNSKIEAQFKPANNPKFPRLKYFLPLDAWFSLIIYPDNQTKQEAIKNLSIRRAIQRIVHIPPKLGGCPEVGRSPTEIDLPACRNF